MIFKIKNRDGAWDFTDKVDAVRFHPYGSFELYHESTGDGPNHVALRYVGEDEDRRHEIKVDDYSYVDVPDLKNVIVNGGVVRCKYVTLLRKEEHKGGEVVTVAIANWAFTATAFLMSDDGKTIERL